MKEIYARRSIRKYKDEPVSDDNVKKLLRAAMYAPSAGNERPWHFVVLKDREKLDAITKFHPFTQMLREAPMAIIVCSDVSNLKYDGAFWVQDIAASIQNILLEAVTLDLGTCWCGVYPREEYIKEVKALLNLPEHIMPGAIVAVGHPNEVREVKERFDEERVHYDHW